MADPTTWIDVADSAVKVGFGLLIGGGISFLHAYFDHDRELKKESAKRQLDKIEVIFNDINEFSQTIALFWANLANGVHKKEKNSLTELDIESLENEEQNVFEKFNVINSARTKLLLINDKHSVLKLDAYKTSCESFFKIAHIENGNCTKENLNNHKKLMIELRDKLLSSVSNKYTI